MTPLQRYHREISELCSLHASYTLAGYPAHREAHQRDSDAYPVCESLRKIITRLAGDEFWQNFSDEGRINFDLCNRNPPVNSAQMISNGIKILIDALPSGKYNIFLEDSTGRRSVKSFYAAKNAQAFLRETFFGDRPYQFPETFRSPV